MIGAASLAFPGGRTLAGWWRQLQGQKPHALWVGYLFAHRVEALVQAVQAKPLDRLSHLLLQGLELQPVAGATLLPLGEALTSQLLRGLAGEGLAEPANHGWHLSDLGRRAVREGTYSAPVQERRIFTLVERVDAACQRQAAPHYLPLGAGPCVPWPAQEPYRLDMDWLRDCFGQSQEWKERFGFPAGVESLLEPNWTANGKADSPPWKRVIVDRPERLLLVFIASGQDPEMIHGFAVKPEGWVLNASEPILHLPRPAATEVIPALTPPPGSTWHTAWAAWCGMRHLPAEAIHDCKVTVEGARLKVAAPAPLVQRLRAARSDVFKGETWLFAGDGHVRAVGVVDVS